MSDVRVRAERGAIGELANDLRELLKLELALARTELAGEVRRARNAVVLLGSAVMLGALGVAMLPVAAAFALGLVIPLWASFLIVGVAFLTVAGILAYVGGRKVAHVDPVPRRALQALQGFGQEVATARRIDATV